MESEYDERDIDESEDTADDEEVGPLVGTTSEQESGVGGLGDHPAPAVMRDPETGAIRQHGEPVNTAGNQVPIGDSSDEESGDGLNDDAREALTREQEPDQQDTDRVDIGTPTEDA
jgi:hypothetical protein